MNIKDSIRKITLVNDLLEKWRYEKKLDRRKLSIEEKTKRLINTYERKVGYRMDINNPRTFKTEKRSDHDPWLFLRSGSELGHDAPEDQADGGAGDN